MIRRDSDVFSRRDQGVEATVERRLEGVGSAREANEWSIDHDNGDSFGVGAVLWTTLGELGFGWSSSPSTTDADPTAPLPGELLRERIRERSQEQLRTWDVVAPSGAR